MNMKKREQIAYCLIRKGSRKNRYLFSPVLYDSRMPIFWLKKVAIEEASDKYDVIKVLVVPLEDIDEA